jgi:hypothetical protein
MTSLVAWISVDRRGASALYFASDSRISWGSSEKWDFGTKLFSVSNYPDIFGYCGDVLFPSQILSRVIALANLGGLFCEADNPENKFNKVKSLITSAFDSYPKEKPLPFTILHGSRIGESNNCAFELRSLSWDQQNEFSSKEYVIPSVSGQIVSLGTGKDVIDEFNQVWQGSEIKKTSRSIYMAFCDTLKSHKDPFTGGAPQVVTIQRDFASKPLGIVFEGEQYLSGLKLESSFNKFYFDWYNECFERCNPETGLILAGAQRQPRPRNI